jgi:hypothetical protein
MDKNKFIERSRNRLLSNARQCSFDDNAIIITIHGHEVIIDKEDFNRVAEIGCWQIHDAGNNKYVVHYNYKLLPAIRLHRIIINCPNDKVVDHINGDTFDNRKSNLRICTIHQNNFNKTKQKRNTSGYKGVSWHIHDKKWQVTIQVSGKKLYIGQYHDIQEAHKAYCEAAIKYHGEYARFA